MMLRKDFKAPPSTTVIFSYLDSGVRRRQIGVSELCLKEKEGPYPTSSPSPQMTCPS